MRLLASIIVLLGAGLVVSQPAPKTLAGSPWTGGTLKGAGNLTDGVWVPQLDADGKPTGAAFRPIATNPIWDSYPQYVRGSFWDYDPAKFRAFMDAPAPAVDLEGHDWLFEGPPLNGRTGVGGLSPGMRFRVFGNHIQEWVVIDLPQPSESPAAGENWPRPPKVAACDPGTGCVRMFGWGEIVRRTR